MSVLSQEHLYSAFDKHNKLCAWNTIKRCRSLSHQVALVLSEYLFCSDTHSLPISSIEDQTILGDQARLKCTLYLQGLTRWHWPSQHGWPIQGDRLSKDIQWNIRNILLVSSTFIKLQCNILHSGRASKQSNICHTPVVIFSPKEVHKKQSNIILHFLTH